MTSPLVNPAAGNRTLSRLDSSRSRSSNRTTNRSGIVGTLFRQFVVAQPEEPREAEPAVGRLVAVANLGHELRSYPMRAFGILAGHRAGGERRIGGGER